MNNLNCIQTNTFEFYNSYHKHPLNKFFHLLGIPIITLTTLILIRDFYFGYSAEIFGFNFKDLKIRVSNLLFFIMYFIITHLVFIPDL